MNDIIRIGFLGASKLGKTTIIALLAARLAKIQLIAMALGDSGRTKITTEYRFRKDWYGDDTKSAEVTFIRVDRWGITNFMRGLNGERQLDEFTESDIRFVTNHLFRILDITDYKDADPVAYLSTRMDKGWSEDLILTNPISLDDLRKLLNYGKIDKFIKRIEVSVPPAFESSKDVVIRDTRGLLDIEVDLDKGVINTDFSPSNLGLENLDAIVFVCSENYEAGAEVLYKKLLSELMNGLPIFFIKNRYDNLFEYYEDNRPDDDIKDYISDIQSGKIKNFKRFDSKFKETYKFLENFGITVQDDDKTWHLVDNYFEDESTIKFAVPMCESILDLSTDSDINKKDVDDVQSYVESIIEESDVKFCSGMVLGMFEMIFNKLDNFFASVHKLFSSGEAKNIVANALSALGSIVDSGINSYVANNGNMFVPRVMGWSQAIVVARINDSTNYDVLGPKDGITTRDGNCYSYGPTLALAVACKRCLGKAVSSINISDHIKDDNGNNIFPDMSVVMENRMFRKGLWYLIYNRMIDTDATFRGESFVNRFEIRNDIENVVAQSDKFRNIMINDMTKFILAEMNGLNYSAIIR